MNRALCGRLLTLAGFAASPAAAQAPTLKPPPDCDLGAVCYIQQYVDTDPGRGATDHACGPLANDGHSGTDFALPSLAMMENGVEVTAAAAGTVRNIRDGMPDISVSDPDAPTLDGRDCGNGVVISHGGGWETQYCHLKRGTVAVTQGERVTGATVLGEVGLSGATSYPHVHLSVRKDGNVVDPFNPDGHISCGEKADRTLWDDPIAYAPGGVVSAGFADRIPGYDSVKGGTAAADALATKAPALVVWGFAFGVRAGDVLRLSIDGPDGPVIEDDVTLGADQPLAFRAIGRRIPAGGWARGDYQGRVVHLRDGDEIDRETVAITLDGP